MPRLPDRLRPPLTRRFQQSIATLAATNTRTIQRMWDSLNTYDEAEVAGLAARSAPTMAAVKSTAMRQATGFYSVLSGVRPPSIRTDELALTADLRQPFIAHWQALASGRPWAEAVAAGSARIEAVVSNYAVSSARQTGDLFVAKANLPKPTWSRVTDANACDWCVEMTQYEYASAEIADFGHDRCNCTPVPNF